MSGKKVVVIKGGLVVTGVEGQRPAVGQVILSEGRVHGVYFDGEVADRVAHELEASGAAVEVYDATGKIVMPGGIDPHVHLEYPQGGNRIYSCDDFYTGSVAAACGGTTTFVDFVEASNDCKKETLMHALEERRHDAESRSVIDFSFHMTINRDNGGDEESLRREVAEVADAGVTSFKMYTAYDGIRVTDAQMLRALRALKKEGGLPIVHAETHDLIMDRVAECKAMGAEGRDAKWQPYTRCVMGEQEATNRVAMLAESVGVPAGIHIVHVTASLAIPTLQTEQHRKLQNGMGPITGEVCTQHLTLTDDVYRQGHAVSCDYVCAPPMRPQENIDAMWLAAANGNLKFVVTDHCPFTKKQRRGFRRVPEFRKHWDAEGHCTVTHLPDTETPETIKHEQWYDAAESELPPFYMMPGGVPGIETRLYLLYTDGVAAGRISLERFVELASSGAAKRYNMFPRKGCLAPGSDADVTVIDPTKKTVLSAETLHQNCDVCPYEGRVAECAIARVYARGDCIVRDGNYVGEACKHKGLFISRPRY